MKPSNTEVKGRVDGNWSVVVEYGPGEGLLMRTYDTEDLAHRIAERMTTTWIRSFLDASYVMREWEYRETWPFKKGAG